MLKNNLKEVLERHNDDLVDGIIDSLSSDNKVPKYISMMSKIDSINRDTILDVIKETLETYDRNYKYSSDRRIEYNISKSNVPRTITTIFGDLTFNRTYYQCKLDNSYHFLIDEALCLEKYDRFDPVVKGISIDNYVNTCQKKSAELTSKMVSPISAFIDNNLINNISRQSINNWLKDWCLPKYVYPTKDTPNTVYIMADEKFIGSQDTTNDIMVKTFVTFEGVKEISKGRRVLVNRHVFSINFKHAWRDFIDEFYSIYDSSKLKNIYVLSDGASWIKAGIPELKMNSNQNIERLLCEFHFRQSINRMTSDKELRKKLLSSFKNNSKKAFINCCNNIKISDPSKSDAIDKNLNYIINNYKAVKDMIDFKIGSSMESHISHCIANFFASRPKGFSSININSYSNTEEVKINDNDLDFNLFSPYSSNLNINNINLDGFQKYKINSLLKNSPIF